MPDRCFFSDGEGAVAVELIGYRHSVYLRIARAVLLEKGVPFRHVEVDPFGAVPEWYRALHPFGRVPVLRHGDFVFYETAAIGRYVDAAFAGARLVPAGARAAGRMQQVIGIVDSYGYWPMVRQVFAHAVFRPAVGEMGDAAEVAAGLAAWWSVRAVATWSADSARFGLARMASATGATSLTSQCSIAASRSWRARRPARTTSLAEA